MTGTRRRSGVTLMEVLIAIMILAIGMLAIMPLFAIGAVNMARTITQDRATTHGVNSDNMFRYYWAQAWNDPATGGKRTTTYEAYGYSQEPMLWLLENHPTYGTIPATSSQPSFPVLVDPVGWQTKAGSGLDQFFIAGSQIPGPPSMPSRTTLRRCINFGPAPGSLGYPLPWAPGQPFVLPTPPQPYQPILPVGIRLTTMLDDLGLAPLNDTANTPAQYMQGEPATPANQIERGGRYNVAWLIRRDRNDFPAEVTLKVLVYAGRSPTDRPSAELPFAAETAPGQKVIKVNLGGQAPPPLRHGSWIAFFRVVPPMVDPNIGQPTTILYPSIEFYRVAGVNDDNVNTTGELLVEIESPIKSEGPAPPTPPGTYMGLAVVFDNLVEVFERGVVTASGGTGR